MQSTKIISSSIGKKAIMAVSGLLLSLFLAAHMAGNFTSLLGRQSFLAYAGKLHSLGILLSIMELGLFVAFGVHIVTGIVLFFSNRQARPSRYQVQKSAPTSLPARLMPYTGLFILFFLTAHLADFHLSQKRLPVADLILDVLGEPVPVLFYLLAVTAVFIHTSHGFWSLLQTLGYSHPRYDKLLQRGTLVLAVTISLVFFVIPLLAIFSETYLR